MEMKKISFGFSKISKKSNLLPTTKNINQTANQLELIKCVEGKEIQLVEEKKEIAPLIIPMPENTKTSAALASLLKRRAVLLGEEDTHEAKLPPQQLQNKNNANTLEERAARELLSELQTNGNDSTTSAKLVLPIVKPDELPLDGAKESTLNDYDDIPVQQFGFAMLRGMGWVEPPPKKNDGVPVDDTPQLRPKGMGLGADKALKPKPLLIAPEANEKLEIKKQACVRILAGKHKDAYGQIEGFDDEHSRVIVKMAIGGAKESFNEFLCQPVSRKEFTEYGKCINSSKYEQYKRLENEHGQIRQTAELRKNLGYKPVEEYATGSNYENKNYREKGKALKHEDEKFLKEQEKSNSRKNMHYERGTERNYANNVERDYSYRQKRHEPRRSRSLTPKHRESFNNQHRNRSRIPSIEKQSTDTSKSSEDSDSAYEHSSLHRNKSKKKKKSAKKYKKKSKTHKNKYASEESDSANENTKEKRAEKSHKKKTKKSKKPRSRSRSKSRERR